MSKQSQRLFKFIKKVNRAVAVEFNLFLKVCGVFLLLGVIYVLAGCFLSTLLFCLQRTFFWGFMRWVVHDLIPSVVLIVIASPALSLLLDHCIEIIRRWFRLPPLLEQIETHEPSQLYNRWAEREFDLGNATLDYDDGVGIDYTETEEYNFGVGDLTCEYNAHSAFLRCAVHPGAETCEGCRDYRSINCESCRDYRSTNIVEPDHIDFS